MVECAIENYWGEPMSEHTKINWVNTLFLIFTPLIGIVGTVLLCVFSLVHWPTWILAGSLCIITGISITAGYHRLFAHRSYKAKWPVRLFFALFGAATFQGSVLEWCTDHRKHHQHTDDLKEDPYSIKKGFWFAHIGWLFCLDTKTRDFRNIQDLKADPILRLQDRYFPIIGIAMGIIFPTAVAALWGDALSGLIIAAMLRITVVHHGTFFINSLCHILGKRKYSPNLSACDSWITAFFTFGEGYHNYHHSFPIDYRNGIRFYHYDPTKWVIRSLSFFKLTYDLKRVSRKNILHYQTAQLKTE